MIIDTHCHFDMMTSPEQYIQKQERVGNVVIGMTNLPSHFELGAPYIKTYKNIRLALGFHPLLVAENRKEISIFQKCIEQTSYIGEIGLDFSREGMASKDVQISILRNLLESLKGMKKIISVHSREAEVMLLDLLTEYDIENVIFHWYTGPIDMIPYIISKGYYFSINESMIKSKNGRAIIKQLPRNRILTETDAPYNTKSSITNTLTYMQMKEQDIQNNFNELISKIR